MLSYSQWGLVADAYIPVLALITLIFLLKELVKFNFQRPLKQLLWIFISGCFVYGVMAVDQALNIWSAVGLDYSTHSAVALIFVVFLVLQKSIAAVLSIVSFVLYAWLMMYLNYHSILDILTTALVVTPIIFVLQKR
ncbi:hypothetical protein HF888_10510 [Bermanella marisrubri]|uniref:Uncharacterized protein n=1 Tax=Bermanella marisrubri TaxID=207949 RepID=Q1N5T2_9GAMM|nr:hypothetical protein [Bermanella marisrubri]EAT13860.1 hypothetical protein RED65_10719 [Oceanobacter sp. RED65] [Bermanella marisrubri]QIZ84621.1 hypothetical protein HF888_10510 [Bermanella marisrubri]